MPARAVLSGTISFGLVSIAVKFFHSASSEQVSFNMLHKKCGGRLKMQFICPTDNEVVERSDTVKGYEYATGQYVQFTEEELKAMEAEQVSFNMLHKKCGGRLKMQFICPTDNEVVERSDT